MKLYLAVPHQSRQPAPESVTRPARTREWISQLPLLNTRESLQQIRDALWGMNRTDVRTAQRLKLLDLYRSPLRVIQRQVETRLTRGAAPLSDADLTVAESFRDCCIEMAYGYKTVVLEIARSRKRRLHELRLSMARALLYLEQTVFACALYRQTPPEGIWTEIHTLYQYAKQLGISEDAVKDSVSKARAATSISLAYRRVLLFGLSDPFHQPVPVIGRMTSFLRRHAQDAELTSYSAPRTERCQFVIDPQSDYPARVYDKQDEITPPRGALLLDTVNLTRNAAEQLERLTSAEQFDVELDDEFQDELGRKLLKEVVYAWGRIPRRSEERAAAGEDRIEVMLGLDVVNYCLNGEKFLELSSTDHADHAATVGTFQLHQVRRQPSRLEKVSCGIVDRAESGLRISIPYDAAAVGSLRVGDIMVLREDSGPWTPGLIRWIRCIDKAIQLGVRKLRSAPRPVAVKPVSTEREEPFREALAMYPEDGEPPLVELITPPGLYRQQRNLFVDDGSTLLMIRTRELIERSQTIDWFDCETINL